MENKKTSPIRYLLPPIIVIIGIAILIGFTKSRSKPPKVERIFPGVLVEVITADISSRTISVTGHGTVKPRHEINLIPQVSGKIEWVNPQFVAGGRFKAGEEILRIEQIDFQLAVNQAEAAVASTEFALKLAKANAEVARNDWETMQKSHRRLTGSTLQNEPDGLVLHEPQLKQAEANLASAKAVLDLALLRLERTVIKAPFACIIRQKHIDIGQFVNAGTPAATLFSIAVAEIEVGISQSELAGISIPGSKALIILRLGEKSFHWDGLVNRSLGFINERERLASVIVQVSDPYTTNDSNRPALSVGSFVEVRIEGEEQQNIFPIPRHALRDGSTVWVAKSDSTLDINNVVVSALTQDEAIVQSGIAEGDRIIVSSISGAAPGLKLRLRHATVIE